MKKVHNFDGTVVRQLPILYNKYVNLQELYKSADEICKISWFP